MSTVAIVLRGDRGLKLISQQKSKGEAAGSDRPSGRSRIETVVPRLDDIKQQTSSDRPSGRSRIETFVCIVAIFSLSSDRPSGRSRIETWNYLYDTIRNIGSDRPSGRSRIETPLHLDDRLKELQVAIVLRGDRGLKPRMERQRAKGYI